MKVAMAPQEQKTQGEEKLAVLQFRFPSKKLSSASNTSQGGAEKKASLRLCPCKECAFQSACNKYLLSR